MKKKALFTLLLLLLALLSACGTKITYPHLEYRNSTFNYDILNKTILLKDGYVIKEGNPYDVVEVDGGYDLVIHFVKE